MHVDLITGGIIMFLLRYTIVPIQSLSQEGEETVNGESKRDIALGALALGVGVALGAVLGNDTTRKTLVDKGKNWIKDYRQN